MRACTLKETDPHVDARAHAGACVLCWRSLHSRNPRERERLGGNGWFPPTVPEPLPPTALPGLVVSPSSSEPVLTRGRVSVSRCCFNGAWKWAVKDERGEVMEHDEEPTAEAAWTAAAEADAELEALGKLPPTWAVAVITAGDTAGAWGRAGFDPRRVRTRPRAVLERTLTSIARAGFPTPHLFVDGDAGPFADLGLPTTGRGTPVLTWAHWWLSVQETVAIRPEATAYAVFQDDLVCAGNLRAYLDRCGWPDRGYLNLYTFPENEGTPGWHEAGDVAAEPDGLRLQGGRGAVALVFSNEAVRALLSSPFPARKLFDPRPEYRNKRADGAVVTAMNRAGWREYCHTPSLVQHTGLTSSMGNGRHALAASFPGEDFDCLSLLQGAWR